MIDIHSHILPGVDDGAQTIEESLLMGKAAVEDGIHTIVATPHHKNGSYENYKNDITIQVAELKRQFDSHGIDLEILPGQENRIHGEFIDGINNDEILALNHTRYVFVEFPSSQVPRYASQMLFDIQVEGFVPVIVHPERNKRILEDPDLLYNFVEKGAFAQVTAASLCGFFGKKIKKFSHQLIDANLVQLVANDAHNTKNRGFCLRQAYQEISKEHGSIVTNEFLNNAEYIISNEFLAAAPPERVKNNFFSKLFTR
ncbi:CpsB/CapC family capsule biosynthesis tyrosine phosphatase [Halobacillus sp. BAB-2008]|uniref:tyrosine-protein phosphatase n=1 Tax=Halobacillus sp. BAB-2008 TaxID=1246484 RepID=UPI0002A514FF|nr:CpsB/CapC family capsule biosynthesis tyrosine phosphatase [Halobacillus sp. BAB-2008]ELK47519.1 capsular polysaccharide biosynthesis protein, putative protein-tyrosine phosphatase [Halobacillus sp. BAB-2008]